MVSSKKTDVNGIIQKPVTNLRQVLMGRLNEIRLWNEIHSTGMIKSTVLTTHVSRLRFAPVTEFAQSSHEDVDIYPTEDGGHLPPVANSIPLQG